MTRFPWLAAAVLLGASAAGAAPAPEAKDDARIHFIPGGVTDADGAKGFVANDKGGVTAVDLESGESLWDSKTAGKPVAVVNGRVLVQTLDPKNENALRVVGLNAETGEKAWEADAALFPKWVSPLDGPGGGRSFSSHSRMDKNALLIVWQANSWYWGGVPPTPEMVKAATKKAEGAARIDLESGKVEMLDKVPPVGPKVSDALRNAAAANYGDDTLTVLTAGDYFVHAGVEATGDNKQKVVLKRWELATEKALDPIVLAEGAMGYQQFTVPSEGVVLVRDATPMPIVKLDTDWTWTAFALATGKQTAQFSADWRGEDITVVGPRAYYVMKGKGNGPPFGGSLPRTLRAVDLKTGKRLWEMALEAERLPPPPPP
jgi:outer membrane protein assembly factor BamB